MNLRTGGSDTAAPGQRRVHDGEFATLKGIGRVSGPVSDWGGYYVSVGKEQNSGYFENLTTDDYTVGNTGAVREADVRPRRAFVRQHQPQPRRLREQHADQRADIDGRLLHDIDPRFDRFTNFNIPGPNYNQDEDAADRELHPPARRRWAA